MPEDEAAILYMANAGAIEMNPWNSTIQKEDYPDWCLIDLDPSEKNTFDQVIETALVTKEVLDGMGVTGYPKTLVLPAFMFIFRSVQNIPMINARYLQE